MNILITGANGFIGRALRSRLGSGNKVIGVDITSPAEGILNIAWEQADLTDRNWLLQSAINISRMWSFTVPVLRTRRSGW